MKLNWKIITFFLIAILLTIANPVFSLSKIPIFNNHNSPIYSFTIAQVGRDDSTFPWYNCSTREAWSPAKKEWCRKVKKLQNMTYIFPDRLEEGDIERSSITLTNGAYYRQRTAQANAFRVELFYNRKEQDRSYPSPENNIIFADLNRDGIDEAIVLVGFWGGGSGYWTHISVVTQMNSTPINIDSINLGDRTVTKSWKVIDGKIQVNLITHAPDDGLCCPTVPVTWTYQLQGNKLIKIS
ncbi:MAG: hypothetical protein QNJ64_03055 [Crocosphaera sp.]|nr:hypothetical protein [Crocosphaera sp.]